MIMKTLKSCKVVMMATEKADLVLNTINNKLLLDKEQTLQERILPINGKCQHLYITSDDEIKEGDYSTDGSKVYLNGETRVEILRRCDLDQRKITASTDTSLNLPLIPESFINAYIKAYNEGKPITEVSIEVMMGVTIVDEMQWENNKVIIKTREDNTVIIHQSKLYTRDEVRQLLIRAHRSCGFDINDERDYVRSAVNDWIQHNL